MSFWTQEHDDVDHGQHEGLTRAQGTFGHDQIIALYAEGCEFFLGVWTQSTRADEEEQIPRRLAESVVLLGSLLNCSGHKVPLKH